MCVCWENSSGVTQPSPFRFPPTFARNFWRPLLSEKNSPRRPPVATREKHMANAINDAPGVDCAFTDAKDSDRRWGYFFTFAHPTSDVLAGWEGPPKKPTDFTKEEFYEHILRCYNDAYPGGFAKVSWEKETLFNPYPARRGQPYPSVSGFQGSLWLRRAGAPSKF